MAAVDDATIGEVAAKLWAGLYEESFRGKTRGRYCLTREQIKEALGTTRLHVSTIQRLQDEALSLGLVIIDLDDLFPCIEVGVVRKYRRPPGEVFRKFFPVELKDEQVNENDEEE